MLRWLLEQVFYWIFVDLLHVFAVSHHHKNSSTFSALVWVIKSILIKEMTPFGLWYLLNPSNTVGIYIHLVLF